MGSYSPIKRFQREKSFALLFDPFRKGLYAIGLSKDSIILEWKNSRSKLPLASIVQPPYCKRRILGSEIFLISKTKKVYKFKALSHKKNLRICSLIQEEWTRKHLSIIKNQRDSLSSLSRKFFVSLQNRFLFIIATKQEQIDQIHQKIIELKNPSTYPAACQTSLLLKNACTLYQTILSKLPTGLISISDQKKISFIKKFLENPNEQRKQGIQKFITSELNRWQEFFETVESNPLTPEQRLAIITDEDATLILAGAGSGKTSVITAKATYLLKKNLREPEQILILAFAKNASNEITERIRQNTGLTITAETFHALAYKIIGRVEGSKPALADHATDTLQYHNLIKDIVENIVEQNTKNSRLVIKWFSHLRLEQKTEWDFETAHQYYTYLKRQDLRTLQGEKVKSYEELKIANWLYTNGIEYKYEPTYEHKLPSSGKRTYQPDFLLTETGIYIEHFGLRREKLVDGSERLITAPYINREDYLKQIEWKRKVHSENQTRLIETYSYEQSEGRLLTSLKEKLPYDVAIRPRPPELLYKRVEKLHQTDEFSQLVGTFLRKFKGGNYSIEDCKNASKQLSPSERERANVFLDIFEQILEDYNKTLGDKIDFEDMILRAVEYVKQGIFVSPFQHILIDEFQDISQSRAQLVKALKAQNMDSRVFAVGDDWQSIFRFAGSDLYFFHNFGSEFGGEFHGESGICKTIDLGRTFRSVEKLAFIARDFVLKNPSQVEKKIIPSTAGGENSVRIINVKKNSKPDSDKKILEALAFISNSPLKRGEKQSVLILGRYQFTRPNIKSLKGQFPNFKIEFRTIHASKGLEADHVILITSDTKNLGFPSKITDDILLNLVSPEIEAFANAEERRVMYVAMTRARHTLTILKSNSDSSSFVRELENESVYGLAGPEDEETIPLICGECGGALLKTRDESGLIFYRCEHFEFCENILPPCPSCKSGLPRSRDLTNKLRCNCGKTFTRCPECVDGWLVERGGPYGTFLGCVRYPKCLGKTK